MARRKTPPPRPSGPVRKSDLVELITLDPSIKLDIRYMPPAITSVGKPVYPEARAFLQRPAAMALLEAHRWLKNQGIMAS